MAAGVIIGDETGLPNNCGLIASAAYWYLRARGVPARELVIIYGEDDGHSIVVYEGSNGILCAYDSEGALIFTPDAQWESAPIVLARAWVKYHHGKKKKVLRARWV